MAVRCWSSCAKPKAPDPAALELEEMTKRGIDYRHTQEPCSGVRKLRARLRAEVFKAGRKRIRRCMNMNEMDICPVYPKPNQSKPAKGRL